MSKFNYRNCNKSSELVATLQIYLGGKQDKRTKKNQINTHKQKRVTH